MSLKQPKRRRGVVLTPTGYQKLQDARLELEVQENFGDRYTLEELSDRTRLDHGTIKKVLECEEGVDRRTLERFFKAFHLELEKTDYSRPTLDVESLECSTVCRRGDLGPDIDLSIFCGRSEELTKLRQWVLRERCRLIAILGMGGIGKTSLTAKFVEQVKGTFEYVIWQSLQDVPPIQSTLANLIQFLSDDQETEDSLPSSLGGRISRLIDYLQEYRCLLVLDNVESVLCGGRRAGEYREGCQGYGEFLKRVGEASCQSCLILTSREKPKEVASLEGKSLPVRSLRLNGLKEAEAHEIFTAKGLLSSEEEIKALVEHYAGNVLALKVVATTIQELFDGNISEFLKQETVVFGDIQDLLDQQFERLSKLEKDVMYWLATNREPVSLSELRQDIVSSVPQPKLLETLESLGRRSLVEKSAALFGLQPVVVEYVTNRFIEQVCEEIATEKINLFRCHALMKAQAKDYVRETQIRLILKPIIDGLFTLFRCKQDIVNHLNQILSNLQKTSPLEPGYTGGNILNLLCHLETDLTGYDLSYLMIWQVDLRNVSLHDVNFAHANLTNSVFADTFGGVFSVALSLDGKLLATGDSNSEIRLWQAVSGQKLLHCEGHTSWVVSLTFNADSSLLASSSTDCMVKLWDISTGQCLQTLQGHSNGVWTVAFSSDHGLLASGSDDQTIRLWRVSTGQCLKILQEHNSWVRTVAFSPDGQTLASGSEDQTIKLWNVNTGKCFKTLQGHQAGVRTVAFSPDGQTLASGSEDQTIKLWNVNTGKCFKTLQGHSNGVWSVAFSPDGQILASGSWDQTVKLWDINIGRCLKTLQGHTNRVFSIAFNPQGETVLSGSEDQTVKLWDVNTGCCLKTLRGCTNQIYSVNLCPVSNLLASGSEDQTVKLWDVNTGCCLKTFEGHTNRVYSVVFSPVGNLLASSSADKTIKLWDITTGRCIRTLQGHSNGIWLISFSPDGQLLASGSEDQFIKLWDVKTGQCIRTLQGHDNGVLSVAFSPDGQLLASSSGDQSIKIWDVKTGQCVKTLQEHTSWVWSVAFSPKGDMLASSSVDRTARLWSVNTGECFRNFHGHTDWIRTVTFSLDGQILASSSHDQTIKLWDIGTGQCLKTLQGHISCVWSINFCPSNQMLVSGSGDETIKLWDINTGQCLNTLRFKRLYECMNITQVTGLTEGTIATLKVLGAVD